MRDFLNEGGRLINTGKLAGRQYTFLSTRSRRSRRACCRRRLGDRRLERAVQATLSNDFPSTGWGLIADQRRRRRRRRRAAAVPGSAPFGWLAVELDGADSAQNQADAAHLGTATHLTTSSVLEPATTRSSRPHGGVVERCRQFDPPDGAWYMLSQAADRGYKRLTRTST